MKDKVLCQSRPVDSDVLGQMCLRLSSGIQYLLAVSPTSIPPDTTRANVVPRLVLVVLIITVGHSSAKPPGNFQKQDFVLIGAGRYTGSLRAKQ